MLPIHKDADVNNINDTRSCLITQETGTDKIPKELKLNNHNLSIIAN